MEWQSSHNLVFYFANENKKLTKKGKKEEKDNDVPPKKGKKKSHNKVRCLSQNFHFYICDTLKLPFFVSCWQVSDVRKKKKGMVNDVSVSNHLMSRHHELDSVLISLQTFEEIESLEIEVKVRMTFMLV
jgi:hypothetical protein